MAGRRYRVEGGDLCAANEEKEEEPLLLLALVAGVARGCRCSEAAGAAAAAAVATAPSESSAAGLEAAAAAAGTITPPGLFPPEGPEQAPGLATVAPSALARQSLSKVLAAPVEGTVAHTGM